MPERYFEKSYVPHLLQAASEYGFQFNETGNHRQLRNPNLEQVAVEIGEISTLQLLEVAKRAEELAAKAS